MELKALIKRLYGIARYHGLDREDCEDVAAEVIIKLHEGKIRNESGCAAAAMNLARDYHRKANGRRGDRPRVMPLVAADVYADLADFTAPVVESFLAPMHPQYREALEVAMLGLTDQESADLLGVPKPTYKTRLMRARQVARERWEMQSA